MKSVLLLSLAVAAGVTACGVPTLAADTIAGRVTAAGAPVAASIVTLWAAGDGAPRQLAQAQTSSDGQFSLSADGNGAILYLIAKGGRCRHRQRDDDSGLGVDERTVSRRRGDQRQRARPQDRRRERAEFRRSN